MCLSTSSALVCCVKLFARTARRILAALSSVSLRKCSWLDNTDTGRWETRTRSQTHRITVHQAQVPQQACCLRHHRVYVVSSFRLLWSAWTHRFLAALDGICGARGGQKHCSTRVHIRRDMPEGGVWAEGGTQTYGIPPFSSSCVVFSSGCVAAESEGSAEGSRRQV